MKLINFLALKSDVQWRRSWRPLVIAVLTTSSALFVLPMSTASASEPCRNEKGQAVVCSAPGSSGAYTADGKRRSRESASLSRLPAR